MLHVSIKRESLLKPLQLVIGVVERRQTNPILSHLLFTSDGNNTFTVIGTDTEIELHGLITIASNKNIPAGQLTIPGKKFLDICKSLPENSIVELKEDENNRVIITCGYSRFVLATLSPQEFPRVPVQNLLLNFEIEQIMLRKLIETTSFAIPQQDVRQYLNGLLFEMKDGYIQGLATDGHRLAIHSIKNSNIAEEFSQIIIPRKGVLELSRLLEKTQKKVAVSFNNHLIRIKNDNFVFISKLINGKFPNYNRIIPSKGDKKLVIDCEILKTALNRVNILSHELFHSVNFKIRNNSLALVTKNPNQEEAMEEINVDYEGQDLDIVFNISYLIDVLNVINTKTVTIFFKQGDTGIIIEESNSDPNCLHVLMPIKQ